MGYLGVVLGTLLVVVVSVLWRVLVYITWRPRALTKFFDKQGVRGPAYKFWSGSLEDITSMQKAATEEVLDIDSHDVTRRVMPHYEEWVSEYGAPFLYWVGPQPRIAIFDAELAKQVLSNKSGFYPKEDPNPSIMALLGKGLILTQGSDWARHRSVVGPAFTMDKLKKMIWKMAECAQSMLEEWGDQAEGQQKEIDVSKQFEELTADIISHTGFGSSYKEGKEVFHTQRELQTFAADDNLMINIPGAKYVPSRRNLQKWALERRVRNTLMHIIQSKWDSQSSSYGNDLLGLMMEACVSDLGQKQVRKMNMDELIDECKTFFFAGHETTSHWLTWTIFLLSVNQEWQEKLRDEVMRECGMEIPTADTISKLKLVGMVLSEALRLYGPVIRLVRKAGKDIQLGSLMIPKGTFLTIPIAMIHRSKEVWGANADEFDPLRFEHGVTNAAKHPNALLAFSVGPRACIGQNFAMLEAKTVIAMILQRFSFSLSPKYVHAPLEKVTLQPQHGLPIVLQPLYV